MARMFPWTITTEAVRSPMSASARMKVAQPTKQSKKQKFTDNRAMTRAIGSGH